MRKPGCESQVNQIFEESDEEDEEFMGIYDDRLTKE